MKQYIPFDYVVTATLLANAAGTAILQINQDADFELHNILGTSTQDAVTDQHSNNFTVLWKDTSTGRQFSNAAVPQKLFCGPSNNSLREFRPILLSRQTNLEFNFVDTSGAGNTVTIVLKGYKVFGS